MKSNCNNEGIILLNILYPKTDVDWKMDLLLLFTREIIPTEHLLDFFIFRIVEFFARVEELFFCLLRHFLNFTSNSVAYRLV